MKKTLLFLAILPFCSLVFSQNANIAKSMHDAGVPPLSLSSSPKTVMMVQDFESFVPFVVMEGWDIFRTNISKTWDTASYSPCVGVQNIHCLNDDALGLQNEYLISPSMNLSGAKSATISFYWSGSKYWSVMHDNCDLFLMVRVGGGAWSSHLWSEEADTSWTSWTWRKDSVVLDEAYLTNGVQFAFNYYGTGGAEFNLDYITIDTVGKESSSARGEINSMETFTRIYPNPANSYLQVKCSDVVNELHLVNTVGRYVYYSQPGLRNVTIDVSSFPEGLYYLEIEKAGGKETRKISISR
jgi:hypothetical protein